MIAEITQFYLPDGRNRSHKTELPDDCAVGYEAMKRLGCRLTAEVLMTGMVSVTIEHEEGDYDINVVKNGPEVQEALAHMLRAFDGAQFEKWLKEVED